MAYQILNPVFAAQFDAFNQARGFAFALLWNPRIGRWVLAQRTRAAITTHELLLGVPEITGPRCHWEPLFICSDSESGCLREPGPWIFKAIAQYAHRSDDVKAREGMFRRMREADAKQKRWAAHQGQHENCTECEESIATLPSNIRGELEEVNRDWAKFNDRAAKSFTIAKE